MFGRLESIEIIIGNSIHAIINNTAFIKYTPMENPVSFYQPSPRFIIQEYRIPPVTPQGISNDLEKRCIEY